MPIYEYRCRKCESKFTVLVRSVPEGRPDTVGTSCPHCGNPDAERVMSTFAYHKSIQMIHDDAGEPSALSGTDFYRDPRNIGRWTEKKFGEMGMAVPPEVRQEIDAARDGQLPDSLTHD
jgi:putative FmdB family regulatory protein